MKTTTKNHVIPYISLIFLFLSPILLSIPVGAQTSWGPQRNTNVYPSRFTSILSIILSIFITGLIFMIFFSIYIRVCSGGGASVPLGGNRRSVAAVVVRGLDSSVIETFPTFSYSEVKDHKIGKGALECAVCLNEFEDDETLRLIPKCDHVFHPECIDAWLGSHVTCPVCRADLVPKPGDEPVLVPGLTTCNEEIHDDDSNGEKSISRNDEIVIDIGDVENEHQEQKGAMNRNLSLNRLPKGPVNQNLSLGNLNRTPTVRVNRNLSFKRPSPLMRPKMFGRSHTMGTILVQPGGDTERFTLRLPSDVRKKVMDQALLNRTKSFANTPGIQGSSSIGYETDRIQRSNLEIKSDRWDFFTRTFSMTMRSPRTPKVVIETGESSKGAGGSTLNKLRSFNCLEPMAVHKTGHFSEELDKSPV